MISLAESQYAWTQKQARLALVILKRYLTKFQKHGMDISDLVNNPKYDADFRVINFEKAISTWTDDSGIKHIIMRFPYNKKIIQLIRTLKDKKNVAFTKAMVLVMKMEMLLIFSLLTHHSILATTILLS